MIKPQAGVTKDEFEQEYAKQCGLSMEKFITLGLYATPCDCREAGCRGWVVVAKGIEDDMKMPIPIIDE